MIFLTQNSSNSFETYKSAWYAGVLFLATLFFANENYYLLLPISIILLEFKSISSYFIINKSNKRFISIIVFTIVFITIAYLNKIFNGNPINNLRDYYAAFLLLPFLLLCGKLLTSTKTYSFLIFLICIEVIIGIAEYYLDVRTFFPIEVPPINSKSGFLYDHRVYGLSINSSVLSFKILVLMLVVETIQLKKVYYFLIQFIVCFGIIVTFNRALILTALLFWVLLALNKLYKSSKISIYSISNFFPLITFFMLFSLLTKNNFLVEMNKNSAEKNPLEIASKISLYTFSDVPETALTLPHPRMLEGKDLDTTLYFTKKLLGSTKGINTSGRILIWANFFQFIEQNLFFGNGSDKLFFKEVNQEQKKLKLVHAHNSFIEILATHGLLISCLFFALLFYLWRKKNSVFIVTILFFSLFQYGIFWGFSQLDLVFISFLVSPVNLLYYDNQ